VSEIGGPYGAVLIVRVWFESQPSPANLRVRLLHNDDPTRADPDTIVVVGVEQTVEAIRHWLTEYVNSCRRGANGAS
jgi:hypothetical protein